MTAVTVMRCGCLILQMMPALQTRGESLIYRLVVPVKVVSPGQILGLYGIINFILLVMMGLMEMSFTAMMAPALQE